MVEAVTAVALTAMAGVGGVAYLGPEGTFTHQAALKWVARAGSAAPVGAVVPFGTTAEVHDQVASGAASRGLIPIENTVEGPVIRSIDALISSENVVAVDAVTLPVSFDAFVRPGHGELTRIAAHPHGLAQCSRFVAERGLTPVPTSSNAAACRDLDLDSVALGPTHCGAMYGLETLAEQVEDFQGAHTRFLVLARRDDAPAHLEATRAAIARAIRRDQTLGLAAAIETPTGAGDGFSVNTIWRTMVAITPVVTGPGVLARITAYFAKDRVNMSSMVTRPLRVRAGQYVFIAALDGAPWEPAVRVLLADLLADGDSLKVLGVYPVNPDDSALDGVLPDHVPTGSVSSTDCEGTQARSLLW
jgi:prephenate dehydratase/chorismate mutase/prephenate dehydratase